MSEPGLERCICNPLNDHWCDRTERDRTIIALSERLEHAERALVTIREAFAVSSSDEENRLRVQLVEDDRLIASLRTRLAEAEQRGRALLAVASAVHKGDGYGCRICGRIRHPAGCDCPIAALDAAHPGWRTEWRHGRPHDARMAEDHDEA